MFSLSRPPASDILGEWILIWGRVAEYRDWDRDTDPGCGLLSIKMEIDLRSRVGFLAISGFFFLVKSCFDTNSVPEDTLKLKKELI